MVCQDSNLLTKNTVKEKVFDGGLLLADVVC